MSIGPCIPDLVASGALTPEQGQEVGQLFAELRQDFRRQFGDQAADAMASDATIAALEKAALRKKRLAAGQVRAQQQMLLDIGGYDGGKGGGPGGGGPGGGGPIDPRAAKAFFDRDGRASYSNIEGRRKAIRARAFTMIDGILADHHSDVTGAVRGKAQLGDIVRELFGEDSGNAHARALAEAWSGAAETLRQRFNAAGGAIGKLEKWGLPQAHDTRRVRAAGFDAWRAEIRDRLDVARMIDGRTGQPFSDAGLETALREVWETIRSDGWNKRATGSAGMASLANRRADHRFLIFKSAEDWLAYQQAFGAGNAFDAMTGHINGMARDIARMEILGPNPDASVRWLKDNLEKTAALDQAPDSKAVDRAFAATKAIDRLYDEYTGAAGRPENRTVALVFSTVRSLQTAAKLGSATLSAVTDTAFGFSARKFNGLPAAGMIGDYIRLVAPGAKAEHQRIVRTIGIAEEWASRTASQGRYLGEELTGEVSRRLAEGVLRVSGLSRWTEAGRWAFGMEFIGHVTDERAKPFDRLDPAFARTLQRYGIGADGWDAIRATPLETDKGHALIKPGNIADQALGDRLYEAILTEMDFAVPAADLQTRAFINSVAPKGTLIGETVRSAALFKSFGISVLLAQSRRIMEQAGPDALRYAIGLAIGTTLTGALALQLKALASGKDPRPMDDAPFWGAAVLQGGGFGIFGDFLQSTENRFGGGFAGTLAGPLAQDLQGIVDAAKAKHPAWAAARLTRQQLPGQSLWFARLAIDRLMADQIQEAIDPNYRESWSRMKKRAREQRTDFWWKPGQMQPDRAPDLANAVTNEGTTP